MGRGIPEADQPAYTFYVRRVDISSSDAERDASIRAPRSLGALYRRLPTLTAQLFGCHSHLRQVEDGENPGAYTLASFEIDDGLLTLRPSAAKRLSRLLSGPVTAASSQRQMITDLLTLFHECIHALGPVDRTAMETAFDGYGVTGLGAFGEGLAEWTAQANLPDFVRGLGLHHEHPWLLTLTPQAAYDAPTAAVGTLIDHVASRRGRDIASQCGELLRAGNPTGSLHLLVQQWVAELPIPSTRRTDVARYIERRLISKMARIDEYGKTTREGQLSMSDFIRRTENSMSLRRETPGLKVA